MADDNQDDDLYEGIRIIGDDTVDDDVTPGASVFDDLDAPDDGTTPGSSVFSEADSDPAAADQSLQEWSALNREGPRWADSEQRAAAAPKPEVAGDQFFEYDDQNDSFDRFDEKVPDFDPPLTPPEAEPPSSTVRVVVDEPTAAAQTAEPVRGRGQPTLQTTPPDGRVGTPDSNSSDRNLPVAIGTAAVLIGAAIIAYFIGPAALMVLATALLGLAAAEFFNAVRPSGYNPPVLLGLAAVVFMSLAAYWRGEAAIPMVLMLTFIFGALWYLTGVSADRPTANLSITFMGVVWIGVLGSYAALLLAVPEYGKKLFLSAVILTVAYDTGAWVVGRAAGRQPLSPASPNKTVEGLMGGSAVAMIAAVLLWVFDFEPFGAGGELGNLGGFWDALLLGIVVALVAPLGDLAESLMKRDLGLKDMGTFLPGHGGVLDRFDALLFVLPAVYFLARIRFESLF
ncbi:MAG: phosphatidate cytidylyltransferase [Acidimicrobiales bacterium]|nr:phosphatidate cytidylyltransferase [Acidimicrobiales bacterium]